MCSKTPAFLPFHIYPYTHISTTYTNPVSTATSSQLRLTASPPDRDSQIPNSSSLQPHLPQRYAPIKLFGPLLRAIFSFRATVTLNPRFTLVELPRFFIPPPAEIPDIRCTIGPRSTHRTRCFMQSLGTVVA